MQMQTIPSLTFSEGLKLGFINYAKFTGRSRRSEFFYFLIGVFVIQAFLSMTFTFSKGDPNEDEFFLVFIPIIFFFITICPILSLTVRRLHDIGYSGAFILIGLIPLFGICYLLYLASIDSEMNSNEYGPSPKYVIPTANTNNYKPPVGPPVSPPVIAVTPIVQPAVVIVPVQPNPVVNPPIAPYPQPIPIVQPPIAPYPQHDPMVPPPMAPYPPQDPMLPPPMYPQQNPIVSPQVPPPYAPPDDPYSRPNPLPPGP